MKSINKSLTIVTVLLFFLLMVTYVAYNHNDNINNQKRTQSSRTFKIIASSENRDLDNVLRQYAISQKLDVSIDYAGTIEIMEKLNSGEKYDAVWTSNSIWLYMLNNNVSVKNSKSTSINPVVFGITKSKAEELGFIGKDVYTKDILNAIESGKLKFNMPSVTQTNTGATAYLGFLTTLARKN